MQEILPILRNVPESQVSSDLDATVAWAKNTGKADTSRLGITGFAGADVRSGYMPHTIQT